MQTTNISANISANSYFVFKYVHVVTCTLLWIIYVSIIIYFFVCFLHRNGYPLFPLSIHPKEVLTAKTGLIKTLSQSRRAYSLYRITSLYRKNPRKSIQNPKIENHQEKSINLFILPQRRKSITSLPGELKGVSQFRGGCNARDSVSSLVGLCTMSRRL